MEFTPAEHELIDHILAAHQKCTIPMEEGKKFVCAYKLILPRFFFEKGMIAQ